MDITSYLLGKKAGGGASSLKWVEIPDPNKPVYAVKVSGQTKIEYEDLDDNGDSYIGTYQINAPDQVIYLFTLSELEDNGYYGVFPPSLFENQWGDTISFDTPYFDLRENKAYISFSSYTGNWIDGWFTPLAWLQ